MHQRKKVKMKRVAAAFDIMLEIVWIRLIQTLETMWSLSWSVQSSRKISLPLPLSLSIISYRVHTCTYTVLLPPNNWKLNLWLQATRSQQIVEENEELLIRNLIVGEEEHDSLILFTSSFVHVLQIRFQVRQAIGTGDHDHVGHILANKGLKLDRESLTWMDPQKIGQ